MTVGALTPPAKIARPPPSAPHDRTRLTRRHRTALAQPPTDETHARTRARTAGPSQIEGGKGTLESYDLEPGDLFFYESAKCFHQRSIPLRGEHYASIFLHYRPVGWNMTRESVRFSIPPNWADGVEREREQRPDQAQAAEGSINAEFTNERDHPVSLWWVDGSQVHHVTQVEGGESARLTTTVGHRFVAKRVVDGAEKEILELAVEPKHAKMPLVIPRGEL